MAHDTGLVAGDDARPRCWWAAADALYREYHDREWGFPVDDDRRLFEKLCLEGFQSGLSWLTILKKRERFRLAFSGFDIATVARFDGRKVERLMRDAGIIRHRGKIESTINNARRALDLVEEHGSLAAYFWQFEPEPLERPRRITYAVVRKLAEAPCSRRLGRDLKDRGFTFVGPVTCYAFIQAMGLVNDHLEGCWSRRCSEDARSHFLVPASLRRG